MNEEEFNPTIQFIYVFFGYLWTLHCFLLHSKVLFPLKLITLNKELSCHFVENVTFRDHKALFSCCRSHQADRDVTSHHENLQDSWYLSVNSILNSQGWNLRDITIFILLSLFRCVIIDEILTGELNLLTTFTHNSEIQIITALSLISKL
jgi:hypothetical protein